MTTMFRKLALSAAMAATAVAGLVSSPAMADPWRGGGYYHHGGGGNAGVAVAAGIIGLAAGVAIASHQPRERVYVEPQPVAYAYPPAGVCYNAYPGYDGYCYPATYYTQIGWGWRDGGWWYRGVRYERPYVIGGWRGGYTPPPAWRAGYGWHEGWHEGWHGGEGWHHDGWRGEGWHGGWRH